jgi:hypothetical protein
MTRRRPQIPEPFAQLNAQLEQWRSTHPPRTRLPESLWQSAVELAQQHGVYQTARPLRLDYQRLKSKLQGSRGTRRKRAHPAFVELIGPRPSKREECVIEVEASRGAKMRIQWKASSPPDWEKLFSAWRDAER